MKLTAHLESGGLALLPWRQDESWHGQEHGHNDRVLCERAHNLTNYSGGHVFVSLSVMTRKRSLKED